MGGIGKREVVGLLLFGIALAVSISFYLPGSSDGGPDTSSLNPRTPQPVTNSAGPAQLPRPLSWQIQYFRDGERSSNSGKETSILNEEYETAPSGYTDNAWRLRADATIQITPGRYTFAIEHRGRVQVIVNGQAVGGGSEAEGTIPIAFTARQSTVRIRIEAQDRAGQFLVRWKE